MTEEASLTVAKGKDGRLWMPVDSVGLLLRKVAANVRAMPHGIIFASQLEEVLLEVAKQIERGEV